MTDGRALRWRGQHERRRAEFVDAAIAAIAEHGADVSTEQIAERAGVARTRLYKHFDGNADLRGAVADRAGELITQQLRPALNPTGSPLRMIATAVRTHLTWLIEHRELYRYLLRHARPNGSGGADDVKTAIAVHLSALLDEHLAALGVDTTPAQTTAFGIVGYVESATTRWLERPGALDRETLVDQLTGNIWAILDNVLRTAGVTVDPRRPLPPIEHDS